MTNSVLDFSIIGYVLIVAIFIWTGFVRTGIGFGGAALGLPLLLLVGASPLYWLPIIGIHLLFFSSITLFKSSNKVDWAYLLYSLKWIIPTVLVGVAGLLSLPTQVMIVFIYVITIIYSIGWIFDQNITSNQVWMDKFLLLVGGYVSGTSLTGAPLLVAVYMRYVNKEQLRNTLFVLWIILVSIKMMTFIIVGVDIDWALALWLMPFAAIGHFIGLKVHQYIMGNEKIFKKSIGITLLIVGSFGLFRLFLS